MTPEERWRRVEELFHAARERTPAERERFLAEQCGSDRALRGEVESLLGQETQAERLLGAPAWAQATVNADDGVPRRLPEGTQLGPYSITGLLGVGGMGEVYRAKDTRLGRDVALKLLPADRWADPTQRHRFLQEARTASALNHPHIMTFHDLAAADGREFLVLEYVAGRTLDAVIPKQGLPLREALSYAVQITDALAAAHAAGVIHRDLKPANIIVNDADTVKLLDFGLAKVIEPTSGNGFSGPHTASGVILGTLHYMSPEQAEGKPADARADLFSFGCVLYEMLTGQRAFQGDSASSTLAAVLRDEPAAVNVARPELPLELSKVVERCLRKNPERRFQTADDLKASLLEVQDQALAAPAPRAGATATRRSALARWTAVLALSVSLAAAVGWFLFRVPAPAEAALLVTPFTSYPGYELDPALSPDGSQIAFEWQGTQRENSDIYIKLVGASEPLRLTTDPARDHSPAWSPDGRSIAFLRELPQGRAAVILLPVLGGAERKLTETASSVFEFPYSGTRAIAWMPDGKALIISDRESASEPLGLFLLSIDTSERRRLTSPQPPTMADRSPAVSPDGRLLIYSRSLTILTEDIFLLALTPNGHPSGEPKPLTHDRLWNDSPAWLDGSREILFSSNRGGVQSLWRMAVTGAGSPRRLPLTGDAQTAPAFSQQAHRLVYVQRFQDANVWRLRLSEQEKPISKPEVLIASSRFDANPAYAPDGQRITFQSDRSGTQEIWVCDHDGSHPRQLTFFGQGHTGSPRWSPDGRWIVFDSNAEGQFEIYLMNAEGGTPKRLTDLSSFNAIPSWSRDGKWIYFSSRRNGQYNIWKLPAPGGGPAIQVTTQGGSFAMESLDGRMLYYQKNVTGPSTEPLWQMPVAGGAEQMVLESIIRRKFVITENGIFYGRQEQSNDWSIHFRNLASGMETAIAHLTLPPHLGFALSPDGKQLLYTQRDQEGSDLMVVENVR